MTETEGESEKSETGNVRGEMKEKRGEREGKKKKKEKRPIVKARLVSAVSHEHPYIISGSVT